MDNSDNNLTYVLVDKTLEDNQESYSKNDVIKEDVSSSNLNYYISVALLSIMGYMILAYSSNVSLMELVDIEVPLIIILSFIIVFLTTNWSRHLTYFLFVVSLAILIGLKYNYSFFLMIVLFSELIIYSINNLVYNKFDYNHE